MKYSQAQKDTLAALVKAPSRVTNCITGVNKVGVILDGLVGYVIPDDLNWIDLERVERVVNIRALGLPLTEAENKLEPTENLVDRGDALVREFRKNRRIYGSPVYIQEKLLKNFELPTFYQDITKPEGPVVITETTQLEGEIVVGFVMPYRLNREN